MDGHLDSRQTERKPRKCFRCGSQDHLIEKCPKPPKENDKQKKVIVHSTTARITVTKGYMHLWHACLLMMNVLVENLVTVHN